MLRNKTVSESRHAEPIKTDIRSFHVRFTVDEFACGRFSFPLFNLVLLTTVACVFKDASHPHNSQREVKITLSPCLTKHHAMKTYWGVKA
jgi:hypothetical protein